MPVEDQPKNVVVMLDGQVLGNLDAVDITPVEAVEAAEQKPIFPSDFKTGTIEFTVENVNVLWDALADVFAKAAEAIETLKVVIMGISKKYLSTVNREFKQSVNRKYKKHFRSAKKALAYSERMDAREKNDGEGKTP